MQKDIKVKILKHRDANLPLPYYATDGGAGLDLIANIPDGFIDLPAGKQMMVGTGIAMHIKDPLVAGQILPRSGLGVKGLVLANTVGLIDSDYQGELMVVLLNRRTDGESIRVSHGDRIAQYVFVPILKPTLTLVDEFHEQSTRGEGGFGHTGEGIEITKIAIDQMIMMDGKTYVAEEIEGYKPVMCSGCAFMVTKSVDGADVYGCGRPQTICFDSSKSVIYVEQ